MTRFCSQRRGVGLIVLSAVLSTLMAAPGEAFDLSTDKVTFLIDTTLSWGARYRLDDRDERIIGLANGGEAFSVNGDDGNLNFSPGLSSNAVKATIDVDIRLKNVGAFFRGSGFYDFELEDGDRARTPLSKPALDWVGSRAELLDAYVWWRFNAGDRRGQLRGGQQVLNWGESTFIPGGISVVNPVDGYGDHSTSRRASPWRLSTSTTGMRPSSIRPVRISPPTTLPAAAGPTYFSPLAMSQTGDHPRPSSSHRWIDRFWEFRGRQLSSPPTAVSGVRRCVGSRAGWGVPSSASTS
jgi:hypothetical protein